MIPAQIPRCSCIPDDWRPCNGESYACDCCGEHFDDPLPYAEPYSSDVEPTEDSSWWFYCRECAFSWIRDGADVRRVVAPASEAA